MPVRLLLVEDHAVLAEATADYLRSMGFEVQIAESADEAIKAAETFGPEIVLCDLSLPDRSGLDVASALHAKSGKALFVLHSALADADLSMLSRQDHREQIQLFLSKPITEQKIETMLRELDLFRQKSHSSQTARQHRAA